MSTKVVHILLITICLAWLPCAAAAPPAQDAEWRGDVCYLTWNGAAAPGEYCFLYGEPTDIPKEARFGWSPGSLGKSLVTRIAGLFQSIVPAGHSDSPMPQER